MNLWCWDVNPNNSNNRYNRGGSYKNNANKQNNNWVSVLSVPLLTAMQKSKNSQI